MKQVAAFAAGLLFALGLGISGMVQVEKVVGFLDVFGAWQPALMFVMVGAIGVHSIGYRLVRGQASPLFDRAWHVPNAGAVTPRLILGSLLFGIGWGLGGFCPGPAVVSLATFEPRPILFVIAMLSGMVVWQRVRRTGGQA